MSRTQEKKKKAPRRHNPLLIMAAAVLAVILGVQILKVYWKLDTAKEQEALLAQQRQELQEDNEALREDLEKKGDEDFIKSLARALGWYEDGARLFVDPNR